MTPYLLLLIMLLHNVGVVQNKYIVETHIGCCNAVRNVESGEGVWFWSSSDMVNQTAWQLCVWDKWERETRGDLDAMSRMLYPLQSWQFYFNLHLISKWQGQHRNQCPADVHRAAASPSGCVTRYCATSPLLSMEIRGSDAKESLISTSDSVSEISLQYLVYFCSALSDHSLRFPIL